MDERVRQFLEVNHSAAMITLRPDGTPHAVRVAIGLVDGVLWSSAGRGRVRTKHLRRDPRCTLFVFETGRPNAARALTLETRVTIMEGPEVPELSIRFFRHLQPKSAQTGRLMWFGQEKTEAELKQSMIEEQRILYKFEVKRAYGLY